MEEKKPQLYLHKNLKETGAITYKVKRGKKELEFYALSEVLFVVKGETGNYVDYGKTSPGYNPQKRFIDYPPFKAKIFNPYFGLEDQCKKYNLSEKIYIPSIHLPSVHFGLEYKIGEDQITAKFEMIDPKDIKELLIESEIYDVKELENKEVYCYLGSSVDIGAISLKEINLQEYFKDSIDQTPK